MNYAIIRSGGKQYKVTEGDVIDVDLLPKKKDEKVIFDQVLLIVNGEDVKIGKPMLEGGKVEATVVENFKGEKVRVAKFKSKVRFRRVNGFRASLTKVKIDKINLTVKKVAETKKAAIKSKE